MSSGVPALRTSVDRSGARVVVRAAGEVDLATAASLRRVLVAAGSPGPVHVVVDLSDVTFVDATGVAAMLQGADAVRAGGGELHLARPSRMLRRVLQLLDLEDRLPVVATGDGARA